MFAGFVFDDEAVCEDDAGGSGGLAHADEGDEGESECAGEPFPAFGVFFELGDSLIEVCGYGFCVDAHSQVSVWFFVVEVICGVYHCLRGDRRRLMWDVMVDGAAERLGALMRGDVVMVDETLLGSGCGVEVCSGLVESGDVAGGVFDDGEATGAGFSGRDDDFTAELFGGLDALFEVIDVDVDKPA